MQKDTKKKTAPLVVGIVGVLAALLPMGLCLFLAVNVLRWVGLGSGGWMVLLFLVFCFLAAGGCLAGVLAATVQRLREIDRGEEEEAKKY